MNADQRLPLQRLSGAGAKVNDAPVWNGTSWVPGTVGDSGHAGTGSLSIVLGSLAVASGASSIAIGPQANATTTGAIAIGDSAQATGAQATALGYSSQATGSASTALGEQSNASGIRTTVLGRSATCSVDDRCLIRNDDLEIVKSSSTGTGTSIILADTVTGTRYRLSVASGALTVALA